jgi:tetratricopeptide (TPR) repeat protein
VSRKLILGFGCLIATVAVVWLANAGHRREWTTGNRAALAELEQGLAAQAKVYEQDARAHFAKAVTLDPSFAAAKLFLLLVREKDGSEEQKTLLAELNRVDLASLTPRERFLLAFHAAGFEHKPEQATRILKDYLAEAPDDPFALAREGNLAVTDQDWARAQRVFTRLVEVAPNRVDAYNELGYLAMAQERFQDSENMFRTYHYLAPDQANPRDSLGELLALIGRYDDAEREFYGALEARPDFCVSYDHLIEMSFLDLNTGRVDEAQKRATQAKTCSAAMLQELSCKAVLVRAVASRDWEAIWQAGLGPCTSSGASAENLRFHAAVWTGRAAEADTWQAKLREAALKQGAGSYYVKWVALKQAHMDGLRLLASGRASEAAVKLATADRGLAYRGLSDGMFKLLNRVTWVGALEASGDRAQTERIASEIGRVNPRVLAVWGSMEHPTAAVNH